MSRRRICENFTASYPHQNCGDGNGHQDGKHCVVIETCTLTKTECEKPCCSAPGAPGWSNEAIANEQYFDHPAGTPQECCNACIADTACLAWWWWGGCIHANITAAWKCGFPLDQSGTDAGVIRCSGGPHCTT
ncbi:4211_t:CDS:2 [Acaulospora morrowiae]|uniref:4211_t:CDS:1 n=1 Tax=Acaulospora morrowiae TaxID=94023 RepID=A0A9N8ZH50_9GLOM|nr:4211_t:CDS:2 [Acaulospora morrowiae]